jgi:hypothetical protein
MSVAQRKPILEAGLAVPELSAHVLKILSDRTIDNIRL